MGGISTRYALADWEHKFMQDGSENYEHHHCKLWINWEGEMQGATIPLGLQFGTHFLTRRLAPPVAIGLLTALGLAVASPLAVYEALQLYNDVLNNPAAKSMLTYHRDGNTNMLDQTLNKHPYNMALYQSLDVLGYPDCRRAAVSQGSSIQTFASGIPGGIGNPGYDSQCMFDVEQYIIGDDIYDVGFEAHTEKVFQPTSLFKSGVTIGNIPVMILSQNQKKVYTKAESIAPGSYERFYRGIFYKIAKLSSCQLDHYRAPFVPTTSTMDIRTDRSLDFSYPVSDSLFFQGPNNHDQTNTFGYPHNNTSLINSKSVTPFDACYSNPFNEFHNQNPALSIADFILLESEIVEGQLQNRSIGGNSAETYQVQFEHRQSIRLGSSISDAIPEGNIVIDALADVTIESQQIHLEDGTHFKSGSRVNVISYSSDPTPQPCFSFENSNYKRSNDEEVGVSDEDETSSNGTMDGLAHDIHVYPNPFRETFTLSISKGLVGSKYQVIDLTGRVLMESNLSQQQISIDARELPAVSILMVTQQNQIFTQKIIRQ